jgi:hypothetical protein
MSDRAKAVLSSGKFYAGWYPRQWLPNGAGKIDNLHEVLLGHVNYAARTSKRLARGLFHAWRGSARNSIASNCSFPGLSVRDGVVCDQRHVFVRAMAARPG